MRQTVQREPNRETILSVQNLAVSYETLEGEVAAVRDVSFDISCGETLGIVGESGCGKSTVAFAIVDFLGRNGSIVGGDVLFRDRSLLGLPQKKLRRLCGDEIAMVYQDPMQALNPTLRIGAQLAEALTEHQSSSRGAAEERCIEMLRRVHMPDPHAVMRRFPHQISGGQQQRALIAMALLNNPTLLIMDEPTTALDVTVEAAVLDLIDELRHEFQTAIMYISHNMGVVARVADRVAVMYAGEIVETATVEDIFTSARHPYTRALVRCVPQLGTSKHTTSLYSIRGRVPAPEDLPDGCLFQPRCDYALETCAHEHPSLREIQESVEVRCHRRGGVKEGVRKPADRPQPEVEPIAASERPSEIVLAVDHVKTYYKQSASWIADLLNRDQDRYVKAVDDVSFVVPSACTIGVVGESGCGKTTLARTIVGLESLTDGTIEFLGFDISAPVGERDLDLVREIQMVFQNPDSTLNPSFTVGFQVSRPLVRFGRASGESVQEEAIRMLEAVRLDKSYYDRFPRQLSGGEKQRVAIARALAARPDLVVCDEPVSSLDVSVQAAVLNLLLDIQQQFDMTMLFIAHDLSVVRFISDYVAVMYLGRICELGSGEAIYSPPYHPYTEALLSAVPIPDPNAEQKCIRLSGTVPSALSPPTGCRFHTRCPRKVGDICETRSPPARAAADGHVIHCHIPLTELRKVEPVISCSPSERR